MSCQHKEPRNKGDGDRINIIILLEHGKPHRVFGEQIKKQERAKSMNRADTYQLPIFLCIMDERHVTDIILMDRIGYIAVFMPKECQEIMEPAVGTL